MPKFKKCWYLKQALSVEIENPAHNKSSLKYSESRSNKSLCAFFHYVLLAKLLAYLLVYKLTVAYLLVYLALVSLL